MRYLNCWDNNNFWGAKSGPLTHASSVKILPRLCLTLWHSITCIASSFRLRLQQQNIRRLPKNNNFRPDIFQPTASTSSSKVPGRTIGILLRVVGGFKKIISINIEILPCSHDYLSTSTWVGAYLLAPSLKVTTFMWFSSSKEDECVFWWMVHLCAVVKMEAPR